MLLGGPRTLEGPGLSVQRTKPSSCQMRKLRPGEGWPQRLSHNPGGFGRAGPGSHPEWACVWRLDGGQAEEGGGCYQGERQILAGSPDGAASCSSRLRRDIGPSPGGTRCCKPSPPCLPSGPMLWGSGMTLLGYQGPSSTKPGRPKVRTMVLPGALAFTGGWTPSAWFDPFVPRSPHLYTGPP